MRTLETSRHPVAIKAIRSGKATEEEVAFLDRMAGAYAADVDVSNADYGRLQRLTGGSLSTETPIFSR